MSRVAAGFFIFALFFALSFAGTVRTSVETTSNTTISLESQRKPSNFLEIADAISQIEQDIQNPRLFNAATAAAYINTLSTQAYGPAHGFGARHERAGDDSKSLDDI